MSRLTDYLELEVPDRGEYPGTWDVPVNSNWDKIDQAIQDAITNRASNDQPTGSGDGSTWYDLAVSLLKIKTPDGFVPVVSHTHNGSIEGVPPINLSTDVLDSPSAKLPGHLVDKPGNNADMLDGYHLEELAGQISGDGLESDGVGKIRMRVISSLSDAIDQFGTNGQIQYSLLFVDRYGRVLSGSKPSTIVGLGITDVYTKTEIQDSFASLNGSAINLFQVKDPGESDLQCAISKGYADARYSIDDHGHTDLEHAHPYHPINGDANTELTVKDPVDNSSTYNSWVMTRSYADSRYVLTSNNTLLALDGSRQMTGELLLNSTVAPSSDYGAVSKYYLLDLFSDYAGNKLNQFIVAKGPDELTTDYEYYALNKLRADEIYAPIHSHDAYQTAAQVDSAILVAKTDLEGQILAAQTDVEGQIGDVQAQLEGAQSTFQNQILDIVGNISDSFSTKQGIVTYKKNTDGTPIFLTNTGLDINIEATAAEPFIANISNSYSRTGESNIIYSTDTNISSAISLADGDGTYFLNITENSYDLVYDVAIADIAATEITLVEDTISLDNIPGFGYLKITGHTLTYGYYSNGLGLITLDTGLEIALDGTETVTLYEDDLATINATYKVLELSYVKDLAPIYSDAQPASPATNQYWFDQIQNIFRQYNGSDWILKPAVFIGEAVVSSASITKLVKYTYGTQAQASGNGNYTLVHQTTGNTPYIIKSIRVLQEDAVVFSGLVKAIKDDTTQLYAAKFEGFAKNDGGTTTVSSTITEIGSGGLAATLTIVANDTDDTIDFTITGVAATTIDWKINIVNI